MFKSKIFKMFSVALLVFLCTFIVPKNANAEILCSNFSENSFNKPLASKSPTIKGSDVLLIGESFIALSHDITKYLEENAHNAGVLANNERFRDYAVSGTKLSGGIYPSIPDQYKNATGQNKVKYVIMDGGGNDCLQSTGQYAQNATNALKNLLAQMKKDEVLKVVYFFYPEPQSDLGGLKNRLDILRPQIQNIVTNNISPKCYWLDLRPVFSGKYSQYIKPDGIHPTAAGSKATADAIWKVIQDNNVFNK